MKKLILLLVLLSAPAFCQPNPSFPNCSSNKVVSWSSATTVSIIPVTTQLIRICQVIFNVQQGAVAVNFSLVSGSGALCTGSNTVTQVFTGSANALQVYSQGVDSQTFWGVGGGTGLCLLLSGSPTSASVQIFYVLI